MGIESGFEYGKQIRSLVYSYNALDNVQYRRSTSLRYDANGNISFKSDVGDYDYGEVGAGLHALTSAGPHHTGYR